MKRVASRDKDLDDIIAIINKSKISWDVIVEEPKDEQKSLVDFGNEGLVCPLCGGPAKRIGNCATYCTSCKQTSRSGCWE